MSKVFVAFYNGLLKENLIPIFYETFCNNMKKAGNELLVEMHQYFGKNFGEIPQEKKDEIERFNPDVCILFNNAYYTLDFLECKKVIIESDSALYYSNRGYLKDNSEKYIFVVSQTDSINIIKKVYGNKCNVVRVPLFTDIKNKREQQDTNISFIGTKFDVSAEKKRYRTVVKEFSDDQIVKYLKILKYLEKHPFCTNDELKIEFIDADEIIDNIDIPVTLHMLGGEKRINVLSQLSDLGLKIYGTRTWADTYFYNTDISRCFCYDNISSLEQNENVYNRSKIGISISHPQALSGYPWRIMDIMASNAALVSDFHSDFIEDFGKEAFPTYDNRFEAREICKKLIDDNEYRREIVGKCNEIIDKKFRFSNYLSRLEEAIDMQLS